VLVLDEADRILDMGFSEQLRSILTYLPSDRQTLLFSATQTKRIKDLAALSLNQPEYVAVHDQTFNNKNGGAGGGGAAAAAAAGGGDDGGEDGDGSGSGGFATPASLKQHYMCVGLGDKLDCLFSFIKAHLKSKTIVFFATCSQVGQCRHESVRGAG
jgi:ATP-dependent RNA helicase DDX10/DBP4